ncbi:MAG: 50S ribosomal protein L21 [Patescibacteria group bacterium]
MFAVIKTGGKQYIVREGQEIKIEKLPGEAGEAVEFDVLLTAEEDGSKVDVGTPLLAKKAKASIVEHGKGVKLDIVKYKAKSRYTRRTGHRQLFTKVKVGKIG